MNRKYQRERDLKSKRNNLYPPDIQQYLDSLSPKKLWEVCKPLPIFLEGLTKEEREIQIQDSRIVVFELLWRRSGGYQGGGWGWSQYGREQEHGGETTDQAQHQHHPHDEH